MTLKFRIHRFKELSSTNTIAARYAADGAEEGLVLVADYQTDGRGKPGRKWISPPDRNLLFSLLIRPPIRPNQAPLLTQIAGRSVAHVLKKNYGIVSTFKRPNDVMVKGKKICGILVEASTRSNGRLEGAIVGVGLNVNAGREDLIESATSLKEATGRTFRKISVLTKLLTQLKTDLKPLYAHPS